MRFTIYLCFIQLLLFSSCNNTSDPIKEGSEEFYKKEIQKKLGGKLEHSVKNGRVDLLTDEVAYEVTWASEWKDAIGKSLWYSMQTHRDAGIILILERKSDKKYKTQLLSTLEFMNGNKEISVKAYPDDFK